MMVAISVLAAMSVMTHSALGPGLKKQTNC